MLHQPPIYFKILNENVFVASRTSATKINSSGTEALEVQSMLIFCPDPIISLNLLPLTLKGGLWEIIWRQNSKEKITNPLVARGSCLIHQ